MRIGFLDRFRIMDDDRFLAYAGCDGRHHGDAVIAVTVNRTALQVRHTGKGQAGASVGHVSSQRVQRIKGRYQTVGFFVFQPLCVGDHGAAFGNGHDQRQRRNDVRRLSDADVGAFWRTTHGYQLVQHGLVALAGMRIQTTDGYVRTKAFACQPEGGVGPVTFDFNGFRRHIRLVARNEIFEKAVIVDGGFDVNPELGEHMDSHVNVGCRFQRGSQAHGAVAVENRQREQKPGDEL